MHDNTISKSHVCEMANNRNNIMNNQYKHEKHENFKNNASESVGHGLPFPGRDGCYTLVVILKVGFHSKVLGFAS